MPGKILLVFQVLAGRNQHIEPCKLSLIETFAVGQRAPGKFQRGADLVTRKISAQWRGRALVEQKAHSRGLQGMRGVLEHELGLLARDAGKPGKKIGELCPVLQVFEQRVDGNARAPEHPGATDALAIPLDGRTGRPVNHTAILGLRRTRHNTPAGFGH